MPTYRPDGRRVANATRISATNSVSDGEQQAQRLRRIEVRVLVQIRQAAHREQHAVLEHGLEAVSQLRPALAVEVQARVDLDAEVGVVAPGLQERARAAPDEVEARSGEL